MRVLLVDDGTLTARGLINDLPHEVQHLNIEFIIAEISNVCWEEKEVPVITSVSSDGSVKEFYGKADDLIPWVKDVEVIVVHKAPITAEVIEAAGQLRLILCVRGHPVNVDIKAASRKGVIVAHLAGRAAVATAELTISLILLLARNIYPAVTVVKEKGTQAWQYRLRSSLEGCEITGKKLGLIGFGEVGRQVAQRARALGMEVLVYSPSLSSEVIASFGAWPVNLPELLGKADFISLHTRPTQQNKKIINRHTLSLMRREACLINTARGELVDEIALAEALAGGKIKAAALDVLTDEPPPPDHPLLQLPNVIITPHIGGKTKEVIERTVKLAAEELKSFFYGLPLRWIVS